MTPQHEQWECDLIAPSAAPGLTDAECDALMDADKVPNYVPGQVGAYEVRARTLIRIGFAANQAHPQGQGEPVELTRLRAIEHAAWHLLDDSEERDEEIAVAKGGDYDELCRLLPEDHPDAAPAASQAAPAAVAEPIYANDGELAGAEYTPAPDPAATNMPHPQQCEWCGAIHHGIHHCDKHPLSAKAQEPEQIAAEENMHKEMLQCTCPNGWLIRTCPKHGSEPFRFRVDERPFVQQDGWPLTESDVRRIVREEFKKRGIE